MKSSKFSTEIDKQVKMISEACDLGDYQYKIEEKLDRYTQKNYSFFKIAFRFLFFHFKSLITCFLEHKSKYSDNVCYILLLPKGGIGDHIYFLKYCYCLRKRFQNRIKINVMLEENDKYLKEALYSHINYIDTIFEGKSPKHDVEIEIVRFPKIKKIDVKRVKFVCDSDLIEYLFLISCFKLNNSHLYRSDYLGRSYSQIYRRKRENQVDVGDFLQMSSVTDFTLSINENVVKSTLKKFGLSQNSYVVLQTGSGHHFKESMNDIRQWPVEYYKKTIFLLKKKHPEMKFVQCGELYQNQIDGVDVDLRGKTTLEEAFMLIKSAKLLISAEGGYPIIRHFVSKKKSCVLFGSTSKDFFGFPENINISANICYGCEWITRIWYEKCLLSGGKAFCMKNLLPEMVVHCIKQEHLL